MARLSDSAVKVLEVIIDELEKDLRVIPTEFGLQYLEEKSSVRAQSIGMMFDDHLKKPLEKHGYTAKKCGSPRVIMIS